MGRPTRCGVRVAWCVVASTLLATGCDAASQRDVDSARAPGASDAMSESRAAQPGDSLQLQLELPDVVSRGTPVTLVLRVRNATARPLDLYLRGRTPTVDVRVEDSAGNERWHRLKDAMIPAIVQALTLDAGKSFEERAEWTVTDDTGTPLAPGRYTVRAFLLGESEAIAAPAVNVRVQ